MENVKGNRAAPAAGRTLRSFWNGPFVLLLAGCVGAGGCAQSTMTAPQRSATEQLLLSTAADRAVASARLTSLAGKKVFVDGTYFDSYDGKYVMGTIRDALSQAGALLVHDWTNSDIIIEARAGALSVDGGGTLFGVPSTGVPVPLVGTVSIPELALYKSDKQCSLAKLALLAYETKSGRHYFSSGPMVGRAYNHYFRFLGLIAVRSTDIPGDQRSNLH